MLAKCESCGRVARLIFSIMSNVDIELYRCGTCHVRRVYPLNLLVTNTVLMGGMANADSLWFDMIHSSLPFYGLSCEQFDDIVAAEIREWEKDLKLLE